MAADVSHLRPNSLQRTTGGTGGSDGVDMESRIQALESSVGILRESVAVIRADADNIKTTATDIKSDVRELRGELSTGFRWYIGLFVTALLAVVGILAKMAHLF